MATRLQVGVSRYPHLEPLFRDPAQFGSDLELGLVEGGAVRPFREILAEAAYDVFEMPIVNYLAAKELGFEATAIPVFTARRFIHRMIEVPLQSPIHQPIDLRGCSIASGYYGNTDAVWARGVLGEDYGVDLSLTTWVSTDEERIPGASTPPDLQWRADENVDELIRRGDVDVKIHAGSEPLPTAGNRFVWENPEQAEVEWFAATGIFPPLQVLVVKDSLLDASTQLARDLFSLFSESKIAAYAEVRSGRALEPRQRAGAFRSGFPSPIWPESNRPYLGEDPLPYGLSANAEALERVIRYSLEQAALRNDHDLEELFVNLD